MKYRLIFLDLDGTLLNSRKKISLRTQQAVKKASEKGVMIIPATGREISNAKNVLYDIDPEWLITSNGALISNLKTGEKIRQIELGKDTIRTILEFSKNESLYPIFATDEKNYISGNKNRELYLKYSRVHSDLEIGNMLYIKNRMEWDYYLNQENEPFRKSLIFDINDKQKKLLKKQFPDGKSPEIIFMSNGSVEINGAGATKGNAAAYLTKHLNCLQTQTAAAGDSENDISLLNFVSAGAVMDNAGDSVKNVADIILPNSDNDGIAVFLEQYILT